MSCTSEGLCGTGGWSGPLPGDPDNNSILTATPAFGGIDVTWTYPTTNPHALAYTILYRSIIPEFNNSLVHAMVAGGFFYDKVNVNERYYYWIEFVSVNGTHGEVIGPATALARPRIEDLIEELTGRIDMGVLALALKTEIARIQPIDDKIFQEIEDRLAANTVLADALADIQDNIDETTAYIASEVTTRTESDSALVTSINTLFASAGTNAAAIITEATARASADSALASNVTTLFSRVNAADAAVITEQTARISADSATATSITDLYAKHGEQATAITAAVSSEATARASADTALASDVTTLFARVGSADAAIVTEATARATAVSAETTSRTTQFATVAPAISTAVAGEATARDSAIAAEASARNTAITAAVLTETNARVAADSSLASSITTAQSTLSGQIASAQTTLQTNINTTNGVVTAIGALYTAKVTVEGLVGGFGIYNSGAEVQAGFDVDTFWVGRTAANKRKPFIIVGSETFIDEAVINKLTFSKLRDEAGTVIVEDGKLLAEYIEVDAIVAEHIDVKSATSGERIEQNNMGIRIYDGAGTLRLKLGNLA